MSNHISNIITKIIENINVTPYNGIIIASPSKEPDYQYHWIRDSALVMRVFIDRYEKTRNNKYLKYILDYVEIENQIQNLNTIGGLGEPKINRNGTAFNGEWGRPQNDGPALRGIMLIKIYNLLHKLYPTICKKVIHPMIMKDLEYVLENYKKPSFDLWEEIYGWHFYTRFVQLKFFLDIIQKYKKYYSIEEVQKAFSHLKQDIKDHINGDFLISSFNIDGNIVKYDDAANLLAYCHIEYTYEIIKEFPLQLVFKNIENLLESFRNKYNDKSIYCIGRYKDDRYYNGQCWVICSLAVAQILLKLMRVDTEIYKKYSNVPETILNKIMSLDSNNVLPEQFNPLTKEGFSADKLTWNYSELYILINNLIL